MMARALATVNRRPTAEEGPVAAVSDSALAPMRLGAFVALAFFGGFGGWAALAPLNGAVVADGVVTVEGSRKSVQHLEGGIVKTIAVKEGDAVAAGQPLIVLDDLAARAQIDIFFQQLVLARATEARLRTELGGGNAVVFPADLAASTDPFVMRAVEGQRSEFAARHAALAGNIAILNWRIGQLSEQNAGSESRIDAYQDQLGSMQAERASLKPLLTSGLTTRSRMLDLDRAIASLEGEIGDARSAEASNSQHIAELHQQIAQLGSDRQAEIASSLDDVEAKILDVAPRLQNARALLERLTVRAPTEGRVVGLTVHTVGAVVAPGAVIMDVVPTHTALVIEARVPVGEIGDLRPGMKAEVRFPSYNPRTTPLLRARLADISADRITDDRTQAAYYRAEIELDPADRAANPGIALYPGMPATVMVTTRARTALDYFLEPLTSAFDRAFKQK